MRNLFKLNVLFRNENKLKMSKKHLTDEEIKGLLDGTKKKSQDFVYFSLGMLNFNDFL